MCEMCDDLEAKIIHFRWMNSVVTDQAARGAAAAIVHEMTDAKAKLHPDQSAHSA